MAGSARVQKVSDEIQKVIVASLSAKIRDPRLKWLSVTAVEVSRDLGSAKVYFSSMNNNHTVAEILKALDAAKGFFRTELAKSLKLRVTPNLRFIHDDSLNYGARMDTLIEKAREHDAHTILQVDELTSEKNSDSDDKREKRQRLR